MPGENKTFDIEEYIRSSASAEDLLNIIKAETPEAALISFPEPLLDYFKQYQQQDEQKAALNQTINEFLLEIRQGAFLAYARLALPKEIKLYDEESGEYNLDNYIVNAGTGIETGRVGSLIAAAHHLLGNNARVPEEQTNVSQLFEKPAQDEAIRAGIDGNTQLIDTGFFLNFRLLAAAEQLRREASYQGTPEEILPLVNSLEATLNAFPLPEQNAEMSPESLSLRNEQLKDSLTIRDLHKLQAHFAQIFLKKSFTKENEAAFKNLALANDAQELKEQLGLFGITNSDWLNDETMPAIQNTAYYLTQVAKVNNPGIARMLAKWDKEEPFSDQEIDAINATMSKYEQFYPDNLLDHLSKNNSPTKNLEEAVSNHEDVKFARTQHITNKPLNVKRAHSAGFDQIILDHFLALEKKESFPEGEAEKLLKDFKSASTFGSFIVSANTSAYKDVFTRPLSEETSLQDLKLRQLAYQKNEDLLLNSHQQQIKGLGKTSVLNKAMADLQEPLRFFEKNSFGLWVLAGDTEARLQRYQKMAADIDIAYKILAAQKNDAEQQLSKIEAVTKAEDMHYLTLSDKQRNNNLIYISYLKKTNEELQQRLADLQHVKNFFHGVEGSGDPLQKKGAIKTLEDAINSKEPPPALQLTHFETGYEDVPRGETPEKDPEIAAASASSRSGSTLKHARLIEPLKPGYDRLHHAKNPQDPSGQAVFVIRESVAAGKVQMTLEKAPFKTQKDKALAAIVFVNQLLANTVPSKDNPVTLRGPEALYVYAALQWAGIPHEAITIGSLPATKNEKKQIASLVKMIEKEDAAVKGAYSQAVEEIKGYNDVKGKLATEITRMLYKVANKSKNTVSDKMKEDYQHWKNQQLEDAASAAKIKKTAANEDSGIESDLESDTNSTKSDSGSDLSSDPGNDLSSDAGSDLSSDAGSDLSSDPESDLGNSSDTEKSDEQSDEQSDEESLIRHSIGRPPGA